MKTPVLLLALIFSPFAGAAGVQYVDGRIGASPVRFIVDTGADLVSIPYREAVRLGIPVFAGKRIETITANGKVGAYRITLASVTASGVTLANVMAQITLDDSGQQTPLLGMSFLGRVNMMVMNGRVRILPSGSSSSIVSTDPPVVSPQPHSNSQQNAPAAQHQAQREANRAACFRIMQELKEIKFLRDQQMDTGGPKSLLEIEREWQGKYQANGCSIWASQFEGR